MKHFLNYLGVSDDSISSSRIFKPLRLQGILGQTQTLAKVLDQISPLIVRGGESGTCWLTNSCSLSWALLVQHSFISPFFLFLITSCFCLLCPCLLCCWLIAFCQTLPWTFNHVNDWLLSTCCESCFWAHFSVCRTVTALKAETFAKWKSTEDSVKNKFKMNWWRNVELHNCQAALNETGRIQRIWSELPLYITLSPPVLIQQHRMLCGVFWVQCTTGVYAHQCNLTFYLCNVLIHL